MAVIKKFRIKSFKKINSVIEFDNVSLAYGNRLILDNINFKIKLQAFKTKYKLYIIQVSTFLSQFLMLSIFTPFF